MSVHGSHEMTKKQTPTEHTQTKVEMACAAAYLGPLGLDPTDALGLAPIWLLPAIATDMDGGKLSDELPSLLPAEDSLGDACASLPPSSPIGDGVGSISPVARGEGSIEMLPTGRAAIHEITCRQPTGRS